MPTQFRKNSFSIASYVLAVGVGCAVTGFGFGIVSGFPIPFLFVWAFFGILFGTIPGLILFVPSLVVSIFLLNLLHLRSRIAAAILGAGGAGATYFPTLGLVAQSYAPDAYWPFALVLTLSGAAAGLVYFWGESVDRPRNGS